MSLENEITTVIFDIGGVVTPQRHVEIVEALAKQTGGSYEKFRGLIEDDWPKAVTGELTILDVYSNLCRNISTNVKPEQLPETHLKLYEEFFSDWNQDVLDLISGLRDEGYKVPCLSNIEPEIADHNREKGLFDYFDCAFLSCEMKMKKPQPKIYKTVMFELGIQPNQGVLVDDREDFGQGAINADMGFIHFQDANQLREEFDRLRINYD